MKAEKNVDLELFEDSSAQNLPQKIREVFSKATCIYSKAQIDKALDQMAHEISEKLSHSNPIFLCVVIGGIIPLGNLLPRLDFPLELDYIHVSRYRGDIVGKDLQWKVLPSSSLKGRTVVIVDDILDGGVTMEAIVNYCHEQGAKEVFTAVLVDKLEARLPGGHPEADFCGLKVDNHYVFGFGLDYKEYLRNAPGIYRVAPEHE